MQLFPFKTFQNKSKVKVKGQGDQVDKMWSNITVLIKPSGLLTKNLSAITWMTYSRIIWQYQKLQSCFRVVWTFKSFGVVTFNHLSGSITRIFSCWIIKIEELIRIVHLVHWGRVFAGAKNAYRCHIKPLSTISSHFEKGWYCYNTRQVD